MTPTESLTSDPALIHVWGQRCTYAATSRRLKKWVVRWRLLVFGLTIAGAILGVLSEQVGGPDWLARALGGLAALAIGFAAFFGKEALTTSSQQEWVRARSTAEALKSLAYLYVTRTAPFDGDDASAKVLARAQELEETNSDYAVAVLSETERRKDVLPDQMTVEQYIDKRILDQKDKYYAKQIGLNQQRLAYGNRARLILGGVAVLLGGAKAMGVPFSTAVWVAVISTISASIASFLFAERYNYLVLSYQATARRLDWLLTQWHVSDKKAAHQIALITGCENTISIENKTWLAEWGKKDKSEEPIA